MVDMCATSSAQCSWKHMPEKIVVGIGLEARQDELGFL